MGEEMHIGFESKKLEGNKHLEDQSVDTRKKIKQIQAVLRWVRRGFIWSRTSTIGVFSDQARTSFPKGNLLHGVD
jgi:hypothetical protein